MADYLNKGQGEITLPYFFVIFVYMEPILDILVVPTYNRKTLAVMDNSYYPTSFVIQSPSLEITIPGFNPILLPFVPNTTNVYSSTNAGFSTVIDDIGSLPDGVYTLKYSVTPAYQYYVEKSIMRTESIQEKFDTLFLKSDITECNGRLKKQIKDELDVIYIMIQSSIAAGNNCATNLAMSLYRTALEKLNQLSQNGCSEC